MGKLYTVFGIPFVCETEVKGVSKAIKEIIRNELIGAIKNEGVTGKVKINIIYQDSTIAQGTFVSDNGQEGDFSFCKSIAPAVVVTMF